MTKEDLGYDPAIGQYFDSQGLAGAELGRVIQEHRERYVVRTENGEYDAEVTGNLRYSAASRADFPAVGDWVALSVYDQGAALILQLYPRRTVLERQAVGKHGEKQIIAANVDRAFILQAVGHDFNLNRMERYLAVCHAAGIQPIAVLTKTDLTDQESLDRLGSQLEKRVGKIPIVCLSNETREGYDQLRAHLEKGKTYCIMGSSGVGKSTLVNNLLGEELLKTSAISESTSKGRHTTSHRELFALENGGILIDTPGMREIGVAGDSDSIDSTFEAIAELAGQCRFSDCTHTEEEGCAILEALDNGEIDPAAFENYQKRLREQSRFQTSLRERREKDRKMGKMYKQIMENKRKNKF